MSTNDAETVPELELLLGAFLPPMRMPMRLPVVQRAIQCIREFIDILRSSSLERQRAELLPLRFDQIQPAGVLGDELRLNLRPRRQCQLGLTTVMRAQVVGGDQPTLRRELCHHLLQQLYEAGAVAS